MSHMQLDVVSYVTSVQRIHSHALFDHLTWPAMTRLTREIIVWMGNRVQFIWETKRACIFTPRAHEAKPCMDVNMFYVCILIVTGKCIIKNHMVS